MSEEQKAQAKLSNKERVIISFLAIWDIVSFFVCNVCTLFYLKGHVNGEGYSKILFNPAHIILASVFVVLINKLQGLYKGVWTFASTAEFTRGAFSSFFCSVFLFIADRGLFVKILGYGGALPHYAYILTFFLLFISFCIPRSGYRILRRVKHIIFDSHKKKRVMIVGAGFMGNCIIDNLSMNRYKTGFPVLAVDDNPDKKGKKINGVKIKGTCNDIPVLAEKYNIDIIIICIPSASEKRQKEILNLALQTNCDIKISPSFEESMNPTAKTKAPRKVEITDLLARSEVKLDKSVCKYLIGETVLVTGGGGSIGSEICRQVARYSPK